MLMILLCGVVNPASPSTSGHDHLGEKMQIHVEISSRTPLVLLNSNNATSTI